MIRPEDIVAAAREQIGTAFHHQGRCSGVGLDCIGLLVHVARALGIPHEDSTAYGRWPRPHMLRAGLANAGLISLGEVKPKIGDVVEITMTKPGRVRHVAIVTDRGLLHTYADVGKVVEHGLDEAWRSRIEGVWRFPGVEHEE